MRHTTGHKNPTSEICQCHEQTSEGRCTNTPVGLSIEYSVIQTDRSSQMSASMTRMLVEAASVVDELSIMEEVCGLTSLVTQLKLKAYLEIIQNNRNVGSFSTQASQDRSDSEYGRVQCTF
jgi:hypothetical protein